MSACTVSFLPFHLREGFSPHVFPSRTNFEIVSIQNLFWTLWYVVSDFEFTIILIEAKFKLEQISILNKF